jgi:two-component system chemotaxis sensor kinase CheA
MDDAFLLELKTGFLQEASELLETVEGIFIQLEKDANNPEHLQSLFRLAHNLKGSGKAVGFDSFAAFCHEFENLLVALKNKQVDLGPSVLQVLFSSVDQLKANVQQLKGDLNSQLDNRAQLAKISLALKTPQPSGPSQIPIEEASPDPKTNSPRLQPSSSTEEVLRVPTRKIEEVLNTLGEQAILQSTLDHAVVESNFDRELLQKTIRQLSKLTFELQQTTISLRMINLKTLVSRLERAVRDAASSTGKRVNFLSSGVESELDKALVDALVDPLVHMVRNSVDHGIEDIAGRRIAGKSEVGSIQLRARRSGAQFLIEVEDDGRGLNAERIRDKAIQSQLIGPDAKLSESEIFRLIFANGFSTRDEVSALSGRGVGMNVVETTLHQLKGSIDIRSEQGRGTCFTLRLPLTLALFNGIVFKIADQRFVVPSGDIDEIVRLDPAQLRDIPMGGRILKVRDEVLPLIDLKTHIAPSSQVGSTSLRKSALVVRTQGRRRAFLIDELLHQSRIVHKKLGKELHGLRSGSGAAVLGDGSVALILDLPSFGDAA